MILSQIYDDIKERIVAISVKTISEDKLCAKPEDFPPTIGTGFVVRADGIVATNNHVVETVSKHIKEDNIPMIATLFKRTSTGLLAISFDLVGSLTLKNSPLIDLFGYGPDMPDVGFLKVKAVRLPVVDLYAGFSKIKEGLDVATAGFPFGEQLMTSSSSVGPILQKGIVSLVFPFYGSPIHGFYINVKSHPGSSGSPVFDISNGKIIGMVQSVVSEESNFTSCVPSEYIRKCLDTDFSKLGLDALEKDSTNYIKYVEEAEKRDTQNYPKEIKKRKDKLGL